MIIYLLHALRVDRDIVPTRNILILQEVAEQANIFKLLLRVCKGLSEYRDIIGTVDGTRDGKRCRECIVEWEIQDGIQSLRILPDSH